MGKIAPPTYLDNHEAVLTAFGYWPTFHDSEVVSLLMDQSGILFDKIHNARIEIVVHAFEWTESKERSEPIFNHHLVHFAFENVSEVALEGFNHQNALHSFDFEEVPEDASCNHSFKVSLKSALGLGGEFAASNGEVISVISCDQEGNPLPSPSGN